MKFETWVYSGKRYLATESGSGNINIIDDCGGNYGSWMSIVGFREKQRKGEVTKMGYYKTLRVALYELTLEV